MRGTPAASSPAVIGDRRRRSLGRRWADLSLGAKSAIVTGIPMLALILVAAAFVAVREEEDRAADLVTRSFEAHIELQHLLTDLVDAETGVRGYQLSGDRSFLHEHNLEAPDLDARFASLGTLISRPELAADLEELRTLVDRRVALLDEARAGHVNLTASKAAMDTVRSKVAWLQSMEDQRLDDRRAAAETTRADATAWILAATLTGLAGGGAAAFLLSAGFVNRIRRLETEATRLSRGERIADLPPGDDEIGRLGATLAATAERLAAVSAEREEARETAEDANRAKSEFLSRMSHELRTPLNSVLGFAQLLERDDLTRDQRENVADILRAGRHLLELIDEVMDISRIEARAMSFSSEPIGVDELLDEAMAIVRPLAESRSIRIEVADPAPGAHVLADRQRLRQVLLNLLSNAIKYNRDGGRVAVSCVEVSAARLRISVADTGFGIPPEKFDRLFQPFDRLGAERGRMEGTGIGLALSRGLVEAMGGQIGVASTIDLGSTFWVELPAAEGPLERLDPVADGPRLASEGTSQRTVLHIEDNLASLRLVERILTTRLGANVLQVTRGDDGLALARELTPDLVLLDVHLPDLPGSEVLRCLRAHPLTRATPVIVLSADATEAQIERLSADGILGYLTKPLDVAKFLGLVDRAFRTTARMA